jgi:hypothetical protein
LPGVAEPEAEMVAVTVAVWLGPRSGYWLKENEVPDGPVPKR